MRGDERVRAYPSVGFKEEEGEAKEDIAETVATKIEEKKRAL